MKTNKSVAVTDDTFLKAYFAKVIKAPGLQQEVKKFLKGGTDSYETILELIHSDYRAQETGEAMRDSVKNTYLSALRRGKTTDTGDAKPPPKEVTVVKFPPNKGSKIPPHIFVQIRDWFQRMIILPHDRSAEDTRWLENFKFSFQDKQYRSPHNRNRSGDNDRGYNNRDRDDWQNNKKRRVNREDDRSHRDNDDYDDFLMWRDNRSASSCRGRRRDDSQSPSRNNNDDERGNRDQDTKRRRVAMFRD